VEDIQDKAEAYIESNLATINCGFKLAMKSTTMILKFSLILGLVWFCCFVLLPLHAIGDHLNSYPFRFSSGRRNLLATGLYFGREDCRRTFIRKIFRNIF
jgi:hypothetical protein